jgi:hypothetical protein
VQSIFSACTTARYLGARVLKPVKSLALRVTIAIPHDVATLKNIRL